jgi:hypothetical protein
MAMRRTIEDALPRRALFGRAVAALAVLMGLPGCHKKALVCDDLSGLTAAEVQLRKTLLYVDASPTPDKACMNCNLFVASRQDDSCGACKVLRGPIQPNGTCKMFLQKSAGGAPT